MVKKKHKHKYYPTGETTFPKPWDYPNKGIEYHSTVEEIPKIHKWMCECGKVKWVKEK